MKKLVVPGEKVSGKPLRMQGIYPDKGGAYAEVVGIWEGEKEKFIPLEAIYAPLAGDFVVGVIDEERIIGYSVDIDAPYKGLIFARDTRTRFAPGDVVFAEIDEVSEVKDIILARAKRLEGGSTITISPAKISRIIGKKSSMIEMIAKMTKCEVYVGKNGIIWLKGGDIRKAVDAILTIEKEAHTSGLTDRIQRFLSGPGN